MNEPRETDRTFGRQKVGRLEAGLLLLFLLGSLLWRLSLIQTARYNPDEFFFLGSAAQVHDGQRPYLDFADPHPLFSYLFYAPAWDLVGERADFIDAFRYGQFFVTLAFLAALFFSVKKYLGLRVALWSLFLLQAFQFFVLRTVHARRDSPSLLLFALGLLALTSIDFKRLSKTKLMLAAGFIGLSIAANLPMGFCALAAASWLFVAWGKTKGWAKGLVLALLFVTGCALTYLGLYAAVFGRSVIDALVAQYDSLALMRMYESFHLGGRHILVTLFQNDALVWLVLAVGIVFAHVQLAKRRLFETHLLLFVLLTDWAILFLLARKVLFEQSFFFVVIFGCVVAAHQLVQGLSKLQTRKGRTAEQTACTLLILALVGWIAFSSWAPIAQERRIEAARKVAPLAQEPSVFAARREIAQTTFDPYFPESKAAQVAQVQFILDHSTPADTVLSSWLNPPLRPLPVKLHHGLVISRLYRYGHVRSDKKLVRILRRFDPGYFDSDQTHAGQMVRMLSRFSPRLILLKGEIGRLFVESDLFFDAIARDHRIVREPVSGALFAVRTEIGVDIPLPESAGSL